MDEVQHAVTTVYAFGLIRANANSSREGVEIARRDDLQTA